MEKLIRGVLSGAFATLPMTLAMLRMKRKEPREWFKALPPRLITLRLAHRLGLGQRLDRKEKRDLVWGLFTDIAFRALGRATRSRWA